jgi:hypothetical protein
MTPLPLIADSQNDQVQSQIIKDRFTGGTSVTFTLQQAPVVGLEMVYKIVQGTPNVTMLLDAGASPPDYTLVGRVLTLHTAPQATDVIILLYPFSVLQF